MYSFPDLEPAHCSMSGSVSSWLAYRYIYQEAGKMAWYFHFFKNFPQFVVIHTVKGFGVVNKAVDVFLELTCFSYDPTDVCNLISGSSAFLNTAWTSGNSQFTYCWSLSWKILSISLLPWDKCDCAVVWTFFGVAFLWDWNETDLFQSCGHCWIFQICCHIECSTFTASSFKI